MNILIDGQTLETEEINRGIGVYFKNVLLNLVKNTIGNIWFITVSTPDAVSKLEKWNQWIAGRLNIIADADFAPSFDYGRAGQYTDKLNHYIEEYQIDCYWNPNPLMVNVLFPNKKISCEFFATIYDLIPYIMPIKEWGQSISNEYYRRLKYIRDLKILCISEATRRDAIQAIGETSEAFVTPLAADRQLFYRERKRLNHSPQVNIVFTGGFDYRKNIYGALAAVSKAIKCISDKELNFYIVCKHTQKEQDELEKKAAELGIAENIVLTGFISDQELSDLYSTADVFFFPSLYEGFGLPLLEAMLGGCYVLSADNSSLPEVCGEYGLYCDASNTDDMALKLQQAIANSLNESLEDKQKRQQYALGFSWEKTAELTYQAFEQIRSGRQYGRKKIAIVTPWPRQQTGIANYIYRLVPELHRYFDIDIFVDNSRDPQSTLLPNEHGGSYAIEELDKSYADYDKIIYQLGNSAEHHYMVYKMLKKHGGIAEIHDYELNPFFYHSYYLNGEQEIYGQALTDGYGEEGREHFEAMERGERGSDGIRFPMSHSVCNIAMATIVHNEWSYHQIRQNNKVFLIPHACFEPDQELDTTCHKARCNILRKIDYQENEIIVGCFGWLNLNKRPDIIIESIKTLHELLQYKVKLVFWGKNNVSNIPSLIKEQKLDDFIKITGYLERTEYAEALKLTDIVVNLRYPSMGESSGTLCEALKAQKAVIVSSINQYREFPDDVCWKLPVGNAEQTILTSMLKTLIDKPEIRERLAYNAKQYADNKLNVESIAKLYRDVLTRE